MVSSLKLHGIGPVPQFSAKFGERLNLVTGDNGLGKTFLLDACWYALTRTWAGGDEHAFYPPPDAPASDTPPSIDYSIIGKNGKPSSNQSTYQYREQKWTFKAARPPMPGLVIYARIDGGFSIWDPARNYWHDNNETTERPSAYHFSNAQVWNGLEAGEGGKKDYLCNGLIRDVDLWFAKKNGAISLLQKVLEELSSTENEKLKIGKSVRVRTRDVRDTPTLEMPYGVVPVSQIAAGMRRVLSLAYMLVWAWEEHKQAASTQKENPTDKIVLLFDEVEAHLHPKWQRVFLPALLNVVDSLLHKDVSLSDKDKTKTVQIIATTHAPLVLASVEKEWDDTRDELFDFDLLQEKNQKPKVVFQSRLFVKRGSVQNWLVSESFNLRTAV